jgi:hypothetical protein
VIQPKGPNVAVARKQHGRFEQKQENHEQCVKEDGVKDSMHPFIVYKYKFDAQDPVITNAVYSVLYGTDGVGHSSD